MCHLSSCRQICKQAILLYVTRKKNAISNYSQAAEDAKDNLFVKSCLFGVTQAYMRDIRSQL